MKQDNENSEDRSRDELVFFNKNIEFLQNGLTTQGIVGKALFFHA